MNMKKLAIEELIKKVSQSLEEITENEKLRFINLVYSNIHYDSELTNEAKQEVERLLGYSFSNQTDIEICDFLLRFRVKAIELCNNHHEKFMDKHALRLVVGEIPPVDLANSTFFHLLKGESNSPYYFTLKEICGNEDLMEGLKCQGIIFIDIIKIPLPLDGELRKKWNRWLVNGCGISLSALLFKIAVEEISPKLNKEIEIALMMPPKTALRIITDTTKKQFKDSLNTINGSMVKMLRARIPLKDNNLFLDQDVNPPTFKVMSNAGSNTPNAKVLKYIFGLS